MLFRGGSNKHLKHLINFVDEYSLYHTELFVSHLQTRMYVPYSDSKNERKKKDNDKSGNDYHNCNDESGKDYHNCNDKNEKLEASEVPIC